MRGSVPMLSRRCSPYVTALCCRGLAKEREAAALKLRSAELLRLGFVMALAMTLHNMPEGFAVRPHNSPVHKYILRSERYFR